MKLRQYRHLHEYAKRRDKGGRRKPPFRAVKPKQYKYLYQKLLKECTIRKAWKVLRRGKSKRKEVKQIDANLDEEVRRMKEMILNTKPPGYEVPNPELAYEPPRKRRAKIVNERGKRRKAYLADIREQWYFHVIVIVLKPIVMRRLHKQSCGSIPGRGPHTGKRYIEKLIKQGKNVKYFAKTDIRHFYDNLQIRVVIRELRTDIADELFIYCIAKVYQYTKKGIMIGLFLSPWIANYVLYSVDDAIRGVTDTEVRYMDDIVVSAGSKKTLFDVINVTKAALGRLHLRLKRNWQVFRFDYVTKKTKVTRAGKVVQIRIGRPLDFMGFVFYRDKTVIRKGILLNATRTARRLWKSKQEGNRYHEGTVRAMLSRMGWFSHTDSYDCYLREVKPYVDIGKLKRIVSKLDKKKNREERQNERMENRALRQAAA